MAAASTVAAATPAAAGILINGYVHDGEWDGARTLYPGSEGRLEAVRDSEFLYLKLTRPQEPMSGADLYIGRASERLFMLHVSSALSEDADLKGQTAYEYGIWGKNADWTVNPINNYYDSNRKMQVVTPDAHEYQIALSKLPTGESKLMFVLKRPEARLPAGADEMKTDGWLRLDIGSVPFLRDAARRKGRG
ncbi:MAG TPA: hypothetical protein VGD10_04005 [Allosphingosinicella sp.]|uniref:hypothetical protein n=1 Tax=Allosphingosinicella sp. TaxID=2823234 RepID=UPI002ED7B982